MAPEYMDGEEDELNGQTALPNRPTDPLSETQPLDDQRGTRGALAPLASSLARMMRPSGIGPASTPPTQIDLQHQPGAGVDQQSLKPTIGQRIMALARQPKQFAGSLSQGGLNEPAPTPYQQARQTGLIRRGLQRQHFSQTTGKDSSARQPAAEMSLDHIQTGAGPVESNPVAWQAFMRDLDRKQVGNFTVGELANVLTNESRDLSFIGPTVSLFDNDLDNAKYVQAHAIINNALRKAPNAMANRAVTTGAATSRGRDRDVAIMRRAYFDGMTKGVDPAQGRTYFGNSADLILKSSPIGNSRHTVFARFGPFALGSQKPRYIYIYNDPLPQKKEGRPHGKP